MKKKKQKKSNKKVDTSEKRRSDLQDLDSQLGSFGLEPPKIYRNEQNNRRQSQSYNNDRQVKNNSRTFRSNQPHSRSNQTVGEQRKVQNKKRKQKNKLRRLIKIAIIIICAIVLALVLCFTVLFKIETITVKGNSIYSTSEITSVLPVEKNDNLLLCDVSSAGEKVSESLPYVYNIEIKRKLPSTLVVNVTETETIYSIKNKDKTYTLLDDKFKVLESGVAKKPDGAIEIKKLALKSANVGLTAEFSSEQVKKDLTKITTQIKSLQLQDEITSIYSVDINNNYIVYDGRITYKLGTTENLENKIYLALTATEKLNESNPSAKGEMSITDGKQVYFTEK
jgi:cell division protein FtsQ